MARARTFSVVIAAFSSDRFGVLCEALEALRSQTAPPLETIVVVDHNDDLLSDLRESQPDIRVLANDRGRGASGARNTGVAAAGGDVVAFIDDDAVAGPRWLEELARPFDGDEVLGAGGEIEPAWVEGRPRWFPREFDWVVGCTYEGMPETTAPVRNLIAANMAVRRDVFDALGGFRADFGKQGARSEPEETELCIRALLRWPERRWIYHPPAAVRHVVPPRRGEWSYFVERCFNEGLGKARLQSYAPRATALASERSYALGVLPRGVLRGLLDTVRRGDPWGAARAAAIMAGLAVTTAGYVRGLAATRRRH